MVEEKKPISLNGVKVTRVGDRVEIVCPMGNKDSAGKTPCDRLAELLVGAKEILTINSAIAEKEVKAEADKE